jgi:hypothetical protein
MSQDTTDNFWAAFATWTPEPPTPVEYRVYYNDEGAPLFYTMEHLPGNYITVDRETYLQAPTHARVMGGKLRVSRAQQIQKLAPSSTGVACDPRDVCVVVDPAQSHVKWNIKHNETD